ncbi:MAG: hypothetical protein A3A94_00085 [Candidatus Portnoybacteria bacterium RIFCSPLOWO2_01_FULL_43_11]|uniref:Nudix hydrolase domain-containing protein n=3 Tax=Bacteria candidate phyla TaxID=1783234 RepID=A0A1G2FNC3_9BACT|nr:MAG: hypothetical protein A2713_00740 [candidate division WWE3 bacterium RIFCSPHIGHO2_01_FULL_35_17]OGZ38299.1 MAG: hypothetical protein A3A94_00085 [Candidatus Portnoybacteria bacterium RIFCSPLOWO2_01_FULL_43_11]OGZ39078.1 MAG: hypothetical protein A3E90_00760 [Candidatus Portnoybacteria bacterium RIFCSPHIGHO2_12_FULL_40_11]
MPKKEVEVLVRAIIQVKGKILVCRKLKRKYFFFPGGHLEFGENTKKALIREIREELGIVIKKCFFIGGTEHIFVEDNRKRQEINLVFEVPIKKITTQNIEDHLRFYFIDKKQLVKEKILPIALKYAIIKWLKDKKIFWRSEI